MSKELSSVQSIDFDAQVKLAAQGKYKLEGTCEYRGGVTGGTKKFRLMGKGIGHERGAPSSDVVPMDVAHSMPTATLTDWEFPEYTDIFNDAEVEFSEVKQLAETIVAAGGRRKDQIQIDTLAAGTFNATLTAGQGLLVDTDVGGAGTGLNVAKLRAIKKMFTAREIEDGINIAIDAEGLDDLLGATEITSTDYASVKALVQGDVNMFLGMNFITFGTRAEGGLNRTGSIQDGYAWTNASVGIAVGIELKVSTDWIPSKSSWLSNGNLKMGGVIIDNEEVCKFQYTV